jgi:CRISPR-associated endonuclease/helicase Cas3
MSLPTADQFEAFYKAVHEKTDDPHFGAFPWQKRLTKRVCDGDWPRAIALPTAAGKTACIDIAVFALACRAKNAPRRIFFVVDRRIVVDQAWIHAKQMATVLNAAKTGILKSVADALRAIAQGDRPLDVYALRGGMYRESAWARSPLQPTILASTVDQVGSRLLFRGYGVSDSMRPIHAGLVANDALILLDEAHCAKPFDQTMQAVESYRTWGEGNRPPFRFVSITATPTQETRDAEEKRKRERPNDPKLIEEDEADDRDEKTCILGKRINAKKPATLVVAEKARGEKKWQDELVKILAAQASNLVGADLGIDDQGNSHVVNAVGVIVNRVATARKLAETLRTKDGVDIVLLTGRMRPFDRKAKLADLEPIMSGSQKPLERPMIVVATQCLEVGADLDFHALVTECASLDALRQRFGRLNRIARRPSAKAVIVIRGDQTEDTTDDPVYGASLANTWKWLRTKAKDDMFDFGVAAVRESIGDEDVSHLNAPAADAPVLFPAHLDCWVQTHPIPQPDPDPAVFLHGPKKSGQPDVHVVFRNDLGDDPLKWADIVSLCPPASSEAVAVPISVFKKWLAGELVQDDFSDVEGAGGESNDDEIETATQTALRWRGAEDSKPIFDPNDVTPNDLYVVRSKAPDVSKLGDFPTGNTDDIKDHAEEAFQESRDKALLRLSGLELDEEEDAFQKKLTEAVRAKIATDYPGWSDQVIEQLTNEKKRTYERYPDPQKGYVVIGKYRLHKFDPTYVDDSEPESSFKGQQKDGRPITLKAHSVGVANHAERFAKECGLPTDVYRLAGLYHDVGKLDPRFQAMLRQSSPRTAAGEPLAKSGQAYRTKQERDQARELHRYPSGARHELLSAAIVETQCDDDLLLHLIATHHGSARPFADHVEENEAAKNPFKDKLFDLAFRLDSAAQKPSAWNASLAERFWRIVRKFGWWGAAYREAVFRLADHTQSRAEQEEDASTITENVEIPSLTAQRGTGALHPIPLTGLNGSNPLAFLAALGTLQVADQLFPGMAKLSWTKHTHWMPILHIPEKLTQDQFVAGLATRLKTQIEDHPAQKVLALLEWARKEAKSKKNSGDDSPWSGVFSKALRDQVLRLAPTSADSEGTEWATAMFAELAPAETSQLLMVRQDYFFGNICSILSATQPSHLQTSLFQTWDYGDALDNLSLHWDPSEDRRHAYQWDQPSGDPARKKRGGMLGANRMAFEAWPFFQSIAQNEKLATRGFVGINARSTFWTWPLWSVPLSVASVASVLAIGALQDPKMNPRTIRSYSVCAAFQCQRITVGKTRNLTPAMPRL